MDLDALQEHLARRPNDRVAVIREGDELTLRWGPDVRASGGILEEPSLIGRMSPGLRETLQNVIAFAILGWLNDLTNWAGLSVLFAVGLVVPVWLRAHREATVVARSGAIEIDDCRLSVRDHKGEVSIELSEVIDLDASEEGLEIFTADGVIATLSGRKRETAAAIASSLRQALGLSGPAVVKDHPGSGSSGYVTYQGDAMGRSITVDHGLIPAFHRRAIARGAFAGAIVAPVVGFDSVGWWVAGICLLVFAVLMSRPAPATRLRVRRDGTYLIEPHSRPAERGDLLDIEHLAVTPGDVDVTERRENAKDRRTLRLRELVAPYIADVRASRQQTVLEFAADDAAEVVAQEVVAHSETTK